MRAAIYARYSSDNQREASIEDQVRLCRARIDREGWSLVETYADYAMSGATTLRAGYQSLLEGARNGKCDIVVAEALDRLTRDQEDVAALYKQLSFAGVRIITLSEGEISELHVGLKGTMNALFLKDLAAKTHRGLEGRVRQGFSGGGNAFGYDVIHEIDERGELVRGKRKINEAEAAIVRRIFADFAAGLSPRAIAHNLNKEGIRGPNGRTWQDSAIRGHATRRTGILRNDLYCGRLIWNKQQYRKDPKTGRRLARLNPISAWITEEVPALRIVEEGLWHKVQTRLDNISASDGVTKARAKRYWEHRRVRHLLTGLLHCHQCGGTFISVGKDYLACGRARRTGTCDNRRGYHRSTLEEAVLGCLKDNLMEPRLVEEFIRAFHEEVNTQLRIGEQGSHQRQKQLDTVTRKLTGLYDAIADGLRTPGIKAKIEDLEAEKIALEATISAAPPPAPRLHPNLAQFYRRKVEDLKVALDDPQCRTEAAETLRGLIERVSVRPTDDNGFEIDLTGAIVGMVDLANTTSRHKKTAQNGTVLDVYTSSVKVVAGTGIRRFRTPVSAFIAVRY